MDKIGKFSGPSVGPATPGTVKNQSVVSPQDKTVTFTGKQEQQQVQQQREGPADKGVKKQDTPAQQGNFQILSARDGKYSIRLTNISENITFGKLNMRDVATLLAKLNMPMTEKNLSLAKSLLEFKMPVTKENLQDLKTALAMMSQKTEGNVQAGVFMTLKSMGMTPENANALQTLFAKNPSIGQQLDNLQKMVAYFASSGQLSDAMLATLMSHVASMFGELISEPGKGEKKLAKKLKDMAEEVGIEDDGGGLGQVKKSDGQSARKNLSKLKQKFNDKVTNLRGYIPKDREELLEEAAELIKELDENLEAQRLINTAPSVDDDNFIYLQIPLKMSDRRTETVHLMMDYEYDSNGQKVVNPQKTKLMFSIQTENMGIINVIMNLWKRSISFSLESESQEVKKHVNKHAPDLIRKLKDKAYRVASWDCIVEKHPVCFPDTLLKKENDFSELDTLDVTI